MPISGVRRRRSGSQQNNYSEVKLITGLTGLGIAGATAD